MKVARRTGGRTDRQTTELLVYGRGALRFPLPSPRSRRRKERRRIHRPGGAQGQTTGRLRLFYP